MIFRKLSVVNVQILLCYSIFNLLVISANFSVFIKFKASPTKLCYAVNKHNRLKHIVSLQLKPYSTVLTYLVVKLSLTH